MTNETIVFPDLEAILVDHIADELDVFGDTASVSVTVPSVRPSRFVTIRRTGGPRRDLVTDTVQVTVEAWAQTGSGALALAQLVRGIINALPGQTISGVAVYRVQEASGPGLLPDPSSNQMRYSYTTAIDARGSARVRSES